MAKLTLIGYWKGERDPDWPDPRAFVDDAWDSRERDLIADHLGTGLEVPWTAAGFSRCRFCGQRNGSVELTDGIYVWPEGLQHYVERHAVRLPHVIVDRMLHADLKSDLGTVEVDRDWWKEFTGAGGR